MTMPLTFTYSSYSPSFCPNSFIDIHIVVIILSMSKLCIETLIISQLL